MDFVLIGIGGALGSIARYQLGKMIAQRAKTLYPVGIFAINVSGAILLGFVSGTGLDGNVYLLISEGFLGAYTTFSTFMYEGFILFLEKKKLNAAIYILTTLMLGVLGYFAGFEISKWIF